MLLYIRTGRIPSWAFSSLGLSLHRTCRHDKDDHPPMSFLANADSSTSGRLPLRACTLRFRPQRHLLRLRLAPSTRPSPLTLAFLPLARDSSEAPSVSSHNDGSHRRCSTCPWPFRPPQLAPLGPESPEPLEPNASTARSRRRSGLRLRVTARSRIPRRVLPARLPGPRDLLEQRRLFNRSIRVFEARSGQRPDILLTSLPKHASSDSLGPRLPGASHGPSLTTPIHKTVAGLLPHVAPDVLGHLPPSGRSLPVSDVLRPTQALGRYGARPASLRFSPPEDGSMLQVPASYRSSLSSRT